MIHEVSKALQDMLSSQLYPEWLMDQDGVQPCIPSHENQDYKVGIYLYDLAEYSIAAQRYATITDHTRVFPSKLISLSYLIYVNEEVQFGGYNKEQEEVLLERMIQVIHDTSALEAAQQHVNLQFENVDVENKIRLWQSLNKPLQPALYIKVLPVEIKSNRQEEVTLVHDITLKSEPT